MNGLALIGLNQVYQKINQFAEQKKAHVVMMLSYPGEVFVNSARNTRTYRDHTRNLRGSIAYAIVFNGDIQKKNLSGTAEGTEKAMELIGEVKSNEKEVAELIGVAGMEYATCVESRGYDVITGSIPVANKELKKIKEALT